VIRGLRSVAGGAAWLGGGLWISSWLLSSQTADNTLRVFGRTEGDYRLWLDPAIACLIVAAVAILAVEYSANSRLGTVGAVAVLAGLVVALAGNLGEFGTDGIPRPQTDSAFIVFLLGYLVTVPIGAAMITVPEGRIAVLVPPGRIGTGLLIAALAVLAVPIVGHFVFGIGWILVGVSLVRRPAVSGVSRRTGGA
jgi:hypothetical protein